MKVTSGYRAGTRQIGLPLKGSVTTLAALCSRVSVASMLRIGMKGRPIIAARKRHWWAALEDSPTTRQRPAARARREAGERPRSSCPKV